MIELVKFQEMIHEMVIDKEGDITVKMDEETAKELIEMLEEKLNEV